MNEPRDLGRRQFLLLAAGFGASVAAGAALRGLWLDGSDARVTRVGRLLDCFGNPASARVVGAACLENVSGERTVTALVRAIERDLGGAAAYRDGQYRLRARISSLVRRDFAALDIVRVHGWVLSRTEARLYALAALDGGRSA